MSGKKTLSTDEQALATDANHVSKRPFQEPKLTFIEPEVVKHGDATKLTKQGFFGTFTPDDQ